jgi:hypothetical protein
MTTDLEERLRADLASDALTAPLVAPEWNELSVRVVDDAHQPRRLPRSLSIAAAVVLLAGGVTALVSQRADPQAGSFTPPGEEFPLTDEFPRTEPTPASLPTDWAAVARPGSAVFASAPGLDGWLATFETVDYDYTTGTLAQWTCLAMSAPQAEFGMICPLDGSGGGSGGDGAAGRSQWVNVPAGTSVVGYIDGTGKMWWQRPIGRLAMFPRSRDDGTFTAYSDDGTALQTFSPATELDVSGMEQGALTDSGLNAGATAMEDSLTPGEREDFRQIVRDRMRNCVEASGATYPNGPMFPVVAADADPATWDNCVDNVRTGVDQRFAALGGHLVPHLAPTGVTDPTPPTTGTTQP